MHEIVSYRNFVLNMISNILKEKNNINKNKFDSTIEYAIVELTKIQLRFMAQSEYNANVNTNDTLSDAIENVYDEIRELYPEFIMYRQYKESLDSLSFPADEMVELKNELISSKKLNRIGAKSTIDNNNYDIIEIGLSGYVEGLIAKPTNDNFSIDFDKIDNIIYKINGNWFPYEISIDSFTYIIDDDGTVFISTDNFPEKILFSARSNLEKLLESICV